MWDTTPKEANLTLEEQILELEVRSASRLNSAGQLVSLKFDEWLNLVDSTKYAKVQKELKAAGRSDSNKQTQTFLE